MTRYHTTAEGNIPFTSEEESEADAMEAEFQSELLSRVKDRKLSELKDKYHVEASSNVDFQDHTYHGGIESAYMSKGKADMVARFKEANQEVPPFALTFNDINDNPITLDTEALQDLAVAIGFAYEAAFQKKAALKRMINALTTISEIEAFDIDVEWNKERGE